MRNEAKLKIKSYHSQFDENIKFIMTYEQELILPLLRLVNVPETISKKQDIRKPAHISSSANQSYLSLLSSINEAVKEEFIKSQDDQVSKFINGRRKILDLDCDISKKILNLDDFKEPEERSVVILAIILLKNINNLTLELGFKGVQLFI